VIIRARDCLAVLREVLDSVFAQAIRFFEAVVVDDDATDDRLTGQLDEQVTLSSSRNRSSRVARSSRRADDSAGIRPLEPIEIIVDGYPTGAS
jgi:glycosyltransferase involved in cell wall biosynthesis